jgi:hypothetical protein
MYGILYFSSKSRVQVTGVPFHPYLADAARPPIIVHTKKSHHKDMWAKVTDDAKHELMEIIGPTGDYDAELTVLKGVYGFLYKYPTVSPTPLNVPIPDGFRLKDAYTFDNPGTQDRDDAISISTFPNPEGDRSKEYTVLGIHITDVARHLGNDWLAWAQQKGASAYWKNGTKPMLPPSLSHDALSLTAGTTRECLTLLMKFKNIYGNGSDIPERYELEMCFFNPCYVTIDANLTYDDLPHHPYYDTLIKISGTTDPMEIIEWCMIQYNVYVAANVPDVLLRVQDEDEKARYDYSGTHFSMFNRLYSHATSPIRRFADFYNQCMYYASAVPGSINTPLLSRQELEVLNDRMDKIREFHNRETVMSLAYECKEKPMVTTGCVYFDEDGESMMLTIAKRRIRIPLADCYYQEAIYDAVKQRQDRHIKVECVGIHKNGKATLRIRLV